jgi:chorismate mutase
MAELEKKIYLVREDILPESILKTALVKEMLANGEAQGVSDAVDKAGIARSTFYKYKDGVFPFLNADNAKIINISLLLKHISGILSGVINCIASFKGNILTINQNLPIHGVAYVTISLSIEEMTVSLDELLIRLGELNGVQKAEIISKS